MKRLTILFAFAIFWLSAMAIELDIPNTIYVYDQPEDVSIRIVNSADNAEQFSIQLNAPTQFELSQFDGTIAGKNSKTVTLTLYPRSDLVGQTYESKLEVTLGNEKYVKQLNIVFRGKQEKIGEEETNGKGEAPSADALTGFFALFAMPKITSELLLNALLAIIAAVLLIAFIARFIKRMEGK